MFLCEILYLPILRNKWLIVAGIKCCKTIIVEKLRRTGNRCLFLEKLSDLSKIERKQRGADER